MTQHITEHSNAQLQKLTSLIDDLKRLVNAKDGPPDPSPPSTPTVPSSTVHRGLHRVAASPGVDSVSSSGHTSSEGSSSDSFVDDSITSTSSSSTRLSGDQDHNHSHEHEHDQAIRVSQQRAVEVGESYDKDIEELRCLLK